MLKFNTIILSLFILKLINNSSRENKENHCHLMINTSFSQEGVFHQISKHCEVVQKISAAPRFFNLLLSVWTSDETHLLVRMMY